MATTSINLNEARNNLKNLTDDIVNFNKHVIITKPNNKNVVLMSESEFRSWQETLYILKSDKNYKALDQSISQMNNGHTKTFSLEDWQKLTATD